MRNVTIEIPADKVEQVQALLALLAPSDRPSPKGKKGKKGKKAKGQPEGLKAAKAHCYEARMARRADASRKGGAGMTKAERLALAAELRAAGKDPSDRRVWNAACAKARGLK